VLLGACLRAGIVPVMAPFPGTAAPELAYLVRHSEAVAIAVPDRLRDFDHERLGHELAREAPGPWSVLVAGDRITPRAAVDLRAGVRPRRRPGYGTRPASRAGPPGQPRCGRVPALRRHHRTAETDCPYA
jgi:2,3-dihydroxybenzoate-AMP ligase